MKFLDQAKIYLKSGEGGAGAAAVRREKFIEFGGPNGGAGAAEQRGEPARALERRVEGETTKAMRDRDAEHQKPKVRRVTR